MDRFYIDDHALIYGLLGKYAEEQCAQGGVAALEKATIQYAKERGIRMAKRCLADGRELSMQSYLLYAEWADTKGWSDIEVSSVVPEFRNHVEKCGWYETWKKHGLMKYGAVYCSFVDKNLVKGFNPALEVEISAVLSHGAPACDFNWVAANFASELEFKALMEQKAAIAPRTVKDFLYHSGHILSALRRVFYTELGVGLTDKICAAALAEYESIMGSEKSNALLEAAKKDFFEI